MNNNLHQSGVKLLNALSRHADLIMQVYLSGSLNEKQHKPGVIDNLIQLGILWRPEDSSELRLKNAVRSLLEGSLQDERNRQVDANIGSALASLTTLAAHYKEALTHGRFAEADAHLNDVTEHVYSLTENLTNNVRVLFGRINNEFGYVASIDAKIRENELAQRQVSEMLKQLELFRFDELSELAGSNRELRHLLVVTLQQCFSRVTQELAIVQARLLELLGRFREFRGRTRLLKGFLLHMEQQPDFTPGNYANLTQVPMLFNQADSLLAPASVDVSRVEHEDVLQQLVADLTVIHRNTSAQPERAAQHIQVEAQGAVDMTDDALKQAVENYFCHVIDTGQRMTALDYHTQHSLEFDPEAWLYQVIGGYQGLSEEEQAYFAIDTSGEPHPIYSGNYIIRDVELGLR
ncbi:phosphoenolpyruvate carboxylase [Aestuariibacter halophilus]|uniref:Phosphoenolpyruvate carboxylase n=1 Tax=Fluctibacter halophilus TaxID=226011 RepID=A0ABS8GE10_9ALTE|nr:phosphoenolpyruvate carboxylase [Aestuariibacter halophilus]MCC2618135.1 phosphoenolpyruvate carboxylase [Aestuariibacter halophilus]